MPQYLIPKATCKETGQTVKSNDLAQRFTISQQHDAQLEANRLSANMTAKTGRLWSGFVETFSLDSAGRTRL
jgi:hypothetical protein